MFCSTLAALVSVIPVLCSLILRSLRGQVIMGTPSQFTLNKTPPARPNLGFTICTNNLAFSLGFRGLKGHLILNPPPGQCSSKRWSNLEHRAGPSLGNLGYVGFRTLSLSGVQLLSGFVSTTGGLAGLVLPLSGCLVTGIPSLIGLSWETEYPSLTVRACDGLSWDTPAGI